MSLARLLWQVAGIVGAGAALGLVLNATSPHPAPLGVPVHPSSASAAAVCADPSGGENDASVRHARISQAEATTACESCSAAFVDARGEAAFARGHIKGAIHLPPEGHAGADDALARLRDFETVIVYGDEKGCRLAEGVADRLVGAGLSDVRLLDAGWDAWFASDAPAQAGACPSCEGLSATKGHR